MHVLIYTYLYLCVHVEVVPFIFADTDLHNVIKKGNILKDVHRRYIMYQVTDMLTP